MTADVTSEPLETLRFPIGRFRPGEGPLTSEERRRAIDRIAAAPSALRRAVRGLDDERLDTPYRPDGWTVRQVVHHVADSHVNAYVRFKLTLTESHPTIRTYREDAWGELEDARTLDVEVSLDLLDALHGRWTALLRTLPDAAWERPLDHPEVGSLGLDQLLGLYAWHGEHHVAHVTELRERAGW